MKHHAFFQFADCSPEGTFERFGMFFTKAVRRKAMADETFEVRELAALHFVDWTIALRAGQRNLIASWLARRMLRACFILHIVPSIWRLVNVGRFAVRQLTKELGNLSNRQAKIDINQLQRVLRHVRRERLGRVLYNRDSTTRFDGVKPSGTVVPAAAQHNADNFRPMFA